MILDRWPHAHTARVICGGLLTLLTTGNVFAQLPACTLRSLSRSAVQTGSTTEVRVTSGDHLDEISALHFSHPGIVAQVGTLPPLPLSDQPRIDYGKFTVTVADDVPPGRYEVRAAGRHGVSNPRAILVSSLPVIERAQALQEAGNAEVLALQPGTIVQAKATASAYDVYTMELTEGQSIAIDLLAQQVDSRMIGQLQLLDPDGRPIARRRGYDHFDVSHSFTAASAGTYGLLVHDVLYRGGDEYPYLLAIQDSETAIDLLGAQQKGQGSGQVPLHTEPRAVTVPPTDSGHQIQFNEQSADSSPVKLPATIEGWFDATTPSHSVRFAAGKHDTFHIGVVSDRLGQPTDVRMQLQRVDTDQEGNETLHAISSEDDSQAVSDGVVNLVTRDPQTVFIAPQDATYQVTVRDLDIGETLSQRQRFRLHLQPTRPGFDLVAYRLYPHRDLNLTQPHGTRLARGGAEVIRVLAIRRDQWSGPITISADQLPDGITAEPVVMAANQSQVDLVLQASVEAAATASPIHVVGRSEDGQHEDAATPVSVLWSKGDGREFIRSRIATSLWAAVSADDLAPVTIELSDDSIPEIKPGQSVSIPVRVQRREGGNQPLILRAPSLPRGFTSGEVNVPADKSDAAIELKTDGNAAAGTYSLWLQAETKIKVPSNPQALVRAQAYRAHLQALRDQTTEQSRLKSIDAAIAEADAAVQAAQPQAQPQETTVFIPTSTTTLRVVQP